MELGTHEPFAARCHVTTPGFAGEEEAGPGDGGVVGAEEGADGEDGGRRDVEVATGIVDGIEGVGVEEWAAGGTMQPARSTTRTKTRNTRVGRVPCYIKLAATRDGHAPPAPLRQGAAAKPNSPT